MGISFPRLSFFRVPSIFNWNKPMETIAWFPCKVLIGMCVLRVLLWDYWDDLDRIPLKDEGQWISVNLYNYQRHLSTTGHNMRIKAVPDPPRSEIVWKSQRSAQCIGHALSQLVLTFLHDFPPGIPEFSPLRSVGQFAPNLYPVRDNTRYK